MPKRLQKFHFGSDFPDARSGESWYKGGNMEWKFCMFGPTSEDENNCIGDLFALCDSQFLTV